MAKVKRTVVTVLIAALAALSIGTAEITQAQSASANDHGCC